MAEVVTHSANRKLHESVISGAESAGATSAVPNSLLLSANPFRTATNESSWSAEDSAQLYGINTWGAGYFRINEKGNVAVTPLGKGGPEVDMLELIADLQDRGIRAPILVRFPDIVKARIRLLNDCFVKAISEYGYKGAYQGVYPIKVNQQHHLLDEIIEFGQGNQLGLECGSKPELLVALALCTTPNALMICNGFKDQEYIETALLSRKLGRNTLIVVDRMSELQVIIDTAKKLNTRPKIGFRAKLDAKGSGKWVESSGARSKFGLTPIELVQGVEQLKKEGMLDCLELLHFHSGSQINSIQAIKAALVEGTRFFIELSQMGAQMKYIDVGGGLGVDYDGSGTSNSSINYSEQEYANDVVATIQSICDEKGISHPQIVTESGRALVAHHSVLVFNVLGVNEIATDFQSPVDKRDHKIFRDLFEIYERVKPENVNEFHHDLQQIKHDVLQLFSYGYLSLEQRAKAEMLIRAIMTKIAKCTRDNEDLADIYTAMEAELTDTYYCNFSVFQSVPDSWAVNQIFPVMPIHRLETYPSRKAVLVDLTCDSDGKIDHFSENGKTKNALELHTFEGSQKPYFLGVFLLGAYQEILGDLHNLFGDTDAVHVGISDAGYTIEHVVEGDSVAEVLSYLQYNRTELVNAMRKSTEQAIHSNSITKHEAKLLLRHYEEGLAGYTYLEEPEII